ncbi:MAG: hypothetical protein JO222_09480 [Frankiales bacterium]|nr:hypothetical protein [Frankiales bacterium]
MHSTLVSRHAVHLLSFGIPVFMLIVGLAWDAVRKHRRKRDVRRFERPLALRVLLAAAVGAAAVHIAVVPEHAREWVGYAIFFVAAAAGQLVGAAALAVGRSRLLCAWFAAGNLGVIGLWAVTRVIGVPVGPGAGQVEPVGVLDVVATGCELLVVLAAAACLWQRSRMPRRDQRRSLAQPAHG